MSLSHHHPCARPPSTTHYPPPTIHYPLSTTLYPLPTAHCLLPSAFCLLLLAGCTKPAPNSGQTAPGTSLAGVKLRLVVVDDPKLAEAVGRLRGEWGVLTRPEDATAGSDFQVQLMTAEELAAAEAMPGDAVICPAWLLGPLAQRQWTAPLSEELLREAAGDWGDMFELLRIGEAVWGSDVVAVPFGSPVLTCYYRADLLQKLGRRPPQTWAEYQQLAELLADRDNLDTDAKDDAVWCGTLEPLGPGWAGLVLLARAAPYAKHRNNYSTLFSIRTMEPLVGGPPFVRALEELVAAAKTGSPDQLPYDPDAVRAAFWQGKCGMALSWPTAAADLPEEIANDVQVGFAELPGSAEAFDVSDQAWEARNQEEDAQVPLLTIAGRIGVVNAASEHPEAAFRLLSWLSGPQVSEKVCASSPATTLLRRSHGKAPQLWVEKPVPSPAAAEYAELTAATFRRQQWVTALRIPGRSEYLVALDRAVEQAVRGELSAAEALQEAADRWAEITERLGLEEQKTAYLHSLGLQ